MIPSKIFYFFGKAIESIRHSPFINIITIGVIAISFLIFSAFLMLFDNLSDLLALWEEEVQVEAYLMEDIVADQIDETMGLILAIKGVEDVSYVSKNEALRRFSESLAGIDSLVEDLGENPLPPSFEIRLNEASRSFDHIEAFAARIEEIDGVDEVIYGREWVERFSTSFAIIKLIGIIVGAFLFMATIFIVSNTIKLTVYARKEELEIMKLMGATNNFIKLPFFIEGLIQGLVGSGISLLMLYITYRVFVAKVSSSVNASIADGAFQINFLSTDAIIYLLLWGMFLGLFGSFVSLGRFLKV